VLLLLLDVIVSLYILLLEVTNHTPSICPRLLCVSTLTTVHIR
jgi:hypothetical protein